MQSKIQPKKTFDSTETHNIFAEISNLVPSLIEFEIQKRKQRFKLTIFHRCLTTSPGKSRSAISYLPLIMLKPSKNIDILVEERILQPCAWSLITDKTLNHYR